MAYGNNHIKYKILAIIFIICAGNTEPVLSIPIINNSHTFSLYSHSERILPPKRREGEISLIKNHTLIFSSLKTDGSLQRNGLF